MTDILLVRHGQASFGEENYDRLSELGTRQAKLLGAHWRQLRWEFHTVWSGTLQRQLGTATHALMPGAERLRADHAFDEYDSDKLLTAYADEVRGRAALQRDPKLFQAELERALLRWMQEPASTTAAPGLLSWPQFSDEAWRTLSQIAAESGRSDRVLIVSSAGVISSLLKRLLNLDAQGFLSLQRRVFNASVTQLSYGSRGFSLVSFNDVAALRLAGDNFVTYR